MNKVAFYTLGCKLNFSESSTISRQFLEAGYQVVDFVECPDIFVINTCSVTDNADKKCKKVVKEALKIAPHAYIMVVGCYAQLKPQEIAMIKGVDVVLGASEKFQILDYIKSLNKKSSAEIYHKPITEASSFKASYSIGDRTRTFLKVQDGCDYSCSFCTIPLARGASRSTEIDEVVNQAKAIVNQGVKEIVLTGVNIGDFGIIEGIRKTNFFELIQQLDQVSGLERVRISSIEPNLLTNEVISFVAQSKCFVPHFHIPLQSGSDKILSLMRRRYKRVVYADRVQQIKTIMPNACIGGDVIVGFPNEQKEDFLDTYQFLNNLPISYLHVFTYSERDNTKALDIENTVPQKERAERSKMLHILSEKKRRYFYESQLGNTYPVLFESDVENGKMYGFSSNYVKVCMPYDPLLINEVTMCKLQHINEENIVEVNL